MDVIIVTAYMAGVVIFFISQHIHHKFTFPQCRVCGWITKDNGICCGCKNPRKYKWE